MTARPHCVCLHRYRSSITDIKMTVSEPVEEPRRRSSSHTITIQSTQLLDSVKKALHLQQFWGASGNFWQSCWNNLYDLSGRNDFVLSVFGTTLITMSVFWIANAFLIALDVTGKPAFLLRYKIQSDQNCPIVMGIPFTMVAHMLMLRRGGVINGDLPTFQWVLLELIVFVLLLHHPKIYRFIHKRHHEWTAPIGIIGLYAHPVEHILSNLMPPFLGPLLMGSHMATIWMWFCMALLSTTVAHCGYHFPLLPSPEAHDFHHLKFNQNYGVLGVLDRLHGTDNQFRASKAYERHILLLGLIPLKQQFPDSQSKKKELMEPVTSNKARCITSDEVTKLDI
ncbi:hypothetical protein KUTeg_024201 [Tegillarca granosa]|uniref:Fatty acid hydroxylase domain-containing protein n=1 Tax=Tegillarca granosa TaxID=220873 RepID=A0ABQ9E2F3_TEGGR|nr:hypothetical protein KUTeg_024201 [Tegillarca granosa]